VTSYSIFEGIVPMINAANSVPGISTTTPPTTGTQAPRSSKSATVDYDQFLQLLVAEMRNQDPTNPTDPTEHVSQLASFSAVEQQVKANTVLSSLLAVEANQILGKFVTSSDGLTSGVVVSVSLSSNNGLSATLEDGTTISLGSGIRISAS
jgi:flagellar basal-body rod modification protein FlgD